MSVTELTALISLLEDPDEGIYHTVRQELEQIGEPVLRPLRTAISEEGHGDVFLSRAKALLDHLGTGEVRSGFADWIGSEDHHVAEALLLLDRYIDPYAFHSGAQGNGRSGQARHLAGVKRRHDCFGASQGVQSDFL